MRKKIKTVTLLVMAIIMLLGVVAITSGCDDFFADAFAPRTSREANLGRIENSTGLAIPEDIEFLWGAFLVGFGGRPSQFVALRACNDLSWLTSQIIFNDTHESDLYKSSFQHVVDTTARNTQAPYQYRPNWEFNYFWYVIRVETSTSMIIPYFIVHIPCCQILILGARGH